MLILKEYIYRGFTYLIIKDKLSRILVIEILQIAR